jgi:hypothetical protein
VLILNTAGNTDGSIDWWMDGVHIGSHSGIEFAASAQHWTQIHYTNLWGGGGGTLNVTQTLDFDHFYASGKQ